MVTPRSNSGLPGQAELHLFHMDAGDKTAGGNEPGQLSGHCPAAAAQVDELHACTDCGAAEQCGGARPARPCQQEPTVSCTPAPAAFAPSVAAGCDFSPMRTVGDIGGGKGTLQAQPHLHCILFDGPAVAADAAAVLQAAGARFGAYGAVLLGDVAAHVYLLAISSACCSLIPWDDHAARPRSIICQGSAALL